MTTLRVFGSDILRCLQHVSIFQKIGIIDSNQTKPPEHESENLHSDKRKQRACEQHLNNHKGPIASFSEMIDEMI